jgi:hypothetical protein
MPSNDTFTCAICGGTFPYERETWSAEEARAELERDYPGTSTSDCEQVCDDCYQKFDRWANEQGIKAV